MGRLKRRGSPGGDQYLDCTVVAQHVVAYKIKWCLKLILSLSFYPSHLFSSGERLTANDAVPCIILFLIIVISISVLMFITPTVALNCHIFSVGCSIFQTADSGFPFLVSLCGFLYFFQWSLSNVK